MTTRPKKEIRKNTNLSESIRHPRDNISLYKIKPTSDLSRNHAVIEFFEDRDRSVPDSDFRAFEITLLWGNIVLDVVHITGKKTISAGAENCDVYLEEVPISDFPLISCTGDCELNFPADIEGLILTKTGIFSTGDMIADGRASPHLKLEETYSLPLPGDMKAALRFGEITVLIRSVIPSKTIKFPLAAQLNYGFLQTILVSFFLHTALLVTALTFPYDTRLGEDYLFTTPNRFARLILSKPEIPEKNPFLQRLNQPESGAQSEKFREDEGKAGRKTAPITEGRHSTRGLEITEELTSQVFHRLQGEDSGLTDIFSKSSFGGLMDHLGNLSGNVAADSMGEEGLGLRGTGRGGGLSGDTIGIGKIGTRGPGTGLFGDGDGAPLMKLQEHKAADIRISDSEMLIRGSLDRELIRRVIHANRNQVRYCYERQLHINPALEGRISVVFTITANGSVSSASISDNSTGSFELADCLMLRLSNWRFPEPLGGGIVVVTYPFVFKISG